MRLRTTAWIALSAMTATLLFTGCDEGLTDSPEAQTGYIYDDVVGGLEYSTPTQSGITGADGSFKFLPGEKVTFKIGNVTLGQAAAAAQTLTLFDLAKVGQNSDGTPSDEVANMAILLQSLDADQDPNNGITITQAARDAFKKIINVQVVGADTNMTKMINTDANLTVALQDKTIALDHLLSTVSGVKGATLLAKQTFVDKNITEIIKMSVDTSAHDLKYALSSTTSTLPLAVGSGLALKTKNSDGSMVFYGITDRGANADAPEGKTTDGVVQTVDGNFTLAKSFPLPNYTPKIAEITVKDGKATVTKTIDLKAVDGTSTSGRPLPLGSTGSTGEVALNDTLTTKLAFDVNGIDPEGIVLDNDGSVWICDEYGPFIAKVNATTGQMIKKYTPGNGLPALLKNRVPNRGMEGVAYDKTTGLVYGVVQTPLDTNTDTSYAGDDTYLTMVELNPTNGDVNLYALPFGNFAAKDVKAGDLVSLGSGKFLMIEQGKDKTLGLVNNIVKFDISNATKITSSEYTGVSGLKNITGVTVIPATRTLIANLRDFGWLPEKAEGMTLLDEYTIAVINDSDFGLTTDASCTVAGVSQELDPKKLRLDMTKTPSVLTTSETKSKVVIACDAGSIKFGLSSNAQEERRTRLWKVKFAQKLTAF